MPAYYNEIDSKAAAWLRELIKQGHIAPGEVDERSIEDVIPSELTGFTQCHFFAGIGVWSYALRQAGWPDDQPVWTGSCPCQPFSAAGKGGGFADERHLWPAFYHLISQCRPGVVFGEQVASKDGLAWLDLVQADLEGADYAVGAVDTCAAGFGAPHIRQRLYWVADAQSQRLQQFQYDNASRIFNQATEQAARLQSISGRGSSISTLADAGGTACQWDTGTVLGTQTQGSGKRFINGNLPERLADGGSNGGLANTEGAGEQRKLGNPASTRSQGHESIQKHGQLGSTHFLDYAVSAGLERLTRNERDGDEPRWHHQDETRSITKASSTGRPGPTNGFWGNADWLFCRDEKWRSVRPGSFPLVDGAPARVGRLRGYGNAIVAPVAQAFIEAYLDLEV